MPKRDQRSLTSRAAVDWVRSLVVDGASERFSHQPLTHTAWRLCGGGCSALPCGWKGSCCVGRLRRSELR